MDDDIDVDGGDDYDDDDKCGDDDAEEDDDDDNGGGMVIATIRRLSAFWDELRVRQLKRTPRAPTLRVRILGLGFRV